MAKNNKNKNKNKSKVKLTPVQQAELKKAEQDTLAKIKLQALNTNRAATESLYYANNLASNVQNIGQAAAAGGKFVDTSEAAGYQSPTTGQMTNYLKSTVKDPFAAVRQAAVQNRVKVSGKKYKKNLFKAMRNDYLSGIKEVKAGGGSGTSTVNYTGPGSSTGNVGSIL
jgi:hypothetical protein